MYALSECPSFTLNTFDILMRNDLIVKTFSNLNLIAQEPFVSPSEYLDAG